MLKPFLLLSAVVLFVIAPTPVRTFAAGGPPQAAPSTSPVKATPASQEKAKRLYGQDCAICHGDNGNGKTDLAKDMQLTLLDWTDAKSLAGMSDQQLFDIIRKGKDKMPAEDASRAKNDDVWNLIIYLRTFSKNQPPPAPAPADAPPAAPADAAPAPAPAANPGR